MKIETLRVQNIKLIEDLTIDFREPDGLRAWTVLLGDNGVCKTSILQAIAIAASGENIARALIPDAADYAHAGRTDRETRIDATFRLVDETTITSTMVVPVGGHAFESEGDGAAYLEQVRNRRSSGHLNVAYGVGRRLPLRGEVAVPTDPHKDRVSGLFDSHHKMLGTDFIEALKSDGGDHLKYARSLAEVLVQALPELSRLETRGYGGVDSMAKLLESRRFHVAVEGGEPLKLAPHQLSQGYQSTVAWVADLLGHAFVDGGESVAAADIFGLVLLDEIDLHLHPTWQRHIVPTLRKIFPRMQFVVTTHSPLVLTGFEAHEIRKLEIEGGRIVQREFSSEPALQSSNDLMAQFFDVPVAGREDLLELERELLDLRAEPASAGGKRATEIRQQLEPYRGASGIPLEEPDDVDDLASTLRSIRAAAHPEAQKDEP